MTSPRTTEYTLQCHLQQAISVKMLSTETQQREILKTPRTGTTLSNMDDLHGLIHSRMDELGA